MTLKFFIYYFLFILESSSFLVLLNFEFCVSFINIIFEETTKKIINDFLFERAKINKKKTIERAVEENKIIFKSGSKLWVWVYYFWRRKHTCRILKLFVVFLSVCFTSHSNQKVSFVLQEVPINELKRWVAN